MSLRPLRARFKQLCSRLPRVRFGGASLGFVLRMSLPRVRSGSAGVVVVLVALAPEATAQGLPLPTLPPAPPVATAAPKSTLPPPVATAVPVPAPTSPPSLPTVPSLPTAAPQSRKHRPSQRRRLRRCRCDLDGRRTRDDSSRGRQLPHRDRARARHGHAEPLGGLAVLADAVLVPEPASGPGGLTALRFGEDREAAALERQRADVAGVQAQATQQQRPGGGRSIARLAIDRAGISADVVPARLVEREGGATWELPAFKVGHAESTAGAGEPGNAILLGHVSSLRSGNVFQDLERVQVGDLVHVFAEGSNESLDYRVVEIDRVPRTDRGVLESSPTPVVSLITCTGMWLPTIWDYIERLVVRAELTASAP